MLYVLTLASAAVYGAADFLGGLASRRANAIAIVVISQLAGLAALALMLPILPAATAVRADFMWGAAAGVMGGIGVGLLYHGLANGVMAIVAPVTALCAVAVPVLTAVALGERPGSGKTGGIVLAILAIALVSQQSSGDDTRDPSASGSDAAAARSSSIIIALASGVAIGLFFLALARTSPAAGMWPLVAARAASFVLFSAIAVVLHTPMRMPSGVAALGITGGILDMLANVLYLLATRHGLLSIVVTLSSLYPASTVLLARVVLGERLSGRQTAGVVCAFAAVVLIVGTK